MRPNSFRFQARSNYIHLIRLQVGHGKTRPSNDRIIETVARTGKLNGDRKRNNYNDILQCRLRSMSSHPVIICLRTTRPGIANAR